MKNSAGKVLKAIVGRLFKGRAFPPSFPACWAVALSSAPASAPLAQLQSHSRHELSRDDPASDLEGRVVNGEQRWHAQHVLPWVTVGHTVSLSWVLSPT